MREGRGCVFQCPFAGILQPFRGVLVCQLQQTHAGLVALLLYLSLILGRTNSGRQNCRAVMLRRLLIRFVENDLVFSVFLHSGFQVVALDDPGDTAEVFVGIHMGSGP